MLDPTLILVKTSKGVEEIKSRSFGLSQNLRSLLIMADGSISLSSLLSRTAQFPKADEDIAWLVREGFVESVSSGITLPASGASGQLPPKQMLIALTRELMGPDATQVLQRLQDAPESVAELWGSVERCHKFIKLTIDEKKAEQFLKAAQGLLTKLK